MNKIAIFVFLTSSITYGMCTAENPIIRLDSTGSSLEDFKTIDQDGMGICYASSAAVLLKSAYPNKETPSQIDLAMKYALENNDKEDSMRAHINGGFTFKAFNYATTQKICRGKDVNLEVASNDYNSNAMRTYFDYIDSFKKNFNSLNTDKNVYFKNLSTLTSEIEKECDKPHDKRIRQSIANAFHSLKTYHDFTLDEVESLKSINQKLSKKLLLIEKIEDDYESLRKAREKLLFEIANANKIKNLNLASRKQNKLNKILTKISPYEKKIETIKSELGADLFAPSENLFSNQVKKLINSNQEFISGLEPEIKSAIKDMDELGKYENSKMIFSSKVEDYLAGEFKTAIREYSADLNRINTIDLEQALKFFNKTIRQKFSALDDFYHSASGTLIDFKMNNPFICAQNYFAINLNSEKSQAYYNMCSEYKKEDADKDSFNALSSILESGSNMDKLFSNIQQMVDLLEDVSSNDEIYDLSSQYLRSQCIEEIDYQSAPRKKAIAVYLGKKNVYNSFRTKLGQKKKVLEKHLWKSMKQGHAIGVSIAGKMLKENYNAFEEETNNTLVTSDFEHGLHAVAIIGVDCSAGKRKYLLQNSWGTSCIGFKDISSIQCEQGTGKLWIEEDYLLNNTRYLSVVK